MVCMLFAKTANLCPSKVFTSMVVQILVSVDHVV